MSAVISALSHAWMLAALLLVTAIPFPRRRRLTDADYANLWKSRITPEFADQCIRRVDSREGAECMNRVDRGEYAGLLIEYRHPESEHVVLHRLRPDVASQKYKYLQPLESDNRLFFPPGTLKAWLQDTTLSIKITEGEKKGLSLACAAFECADDNGRPAFLALAIAGVNNWKVRRNQDAPHGGHVRVAEPLPEFAWINWKGRSVTIVFDANARTNYKVRQARSELATYLKSLGAVVSICDLPKEEGVNGIDDYLGIHGLEAGLDVLAHSYPFEPFDELAALDYSDFGNEESFALLFGHNYLFNWTAELWLRWNDVYWEPDKTGRADRDMLKVAEARLNAIRTLSDEQAREKARKQAVKLRSVRGRKAALESARSRVEFARLTEAFDQDDYLYVVGNGTIDLRSGEFRSSRREDYNTNHTPVNWVAKADYSIWTDFLEGIFPGRPDMIQCIKRAVGYSLTGLTKEEIFFLLYGLGRNGKGTFLRVLMALSGGYGLATDFSTLVADPRGSKGIRNDIAAMNGKRFITAQESNEEIRFDEALIKTLTGGDLVTARFLHQEFFTFRPTWKIWLATNHKPEIRGSDLGIWSRPKLIPFTQNFEGRADTGLKAKLLEPRSLSGVLRWAVEGCCEYLADGLKFPAEVIEATEAYKTESDTVQRYLDENVITGQGQAKARILYDDYVSWTSRSAPLTEVAFSKKLAEKGFKKRKTETGMVYDGIFMLRKSRSDNDEAKSSVEKSTIGY